MKEADLQRTILDAAKLGRWLVFHDFDSQKNQPGFPDVVLVRGGRLVFWELKSETGSLRPDQQAWRAGLELIQAKTDGVVTYDIVRPTDLNRSIEILTKRES